METTTHKPDVRVDFVRGNLENPTGIAYVYTHTPGNRPLAMLATRDFNEIRRGIQKISYVIDPEMKHTIWAGPVKTSTQKMLAAGLEDILKVTNIGCKKTKDALTSAILMYERLISEHHISKGMPPGRMRRYHELKDSSDLIMYVLAAFVKPMKYAVILQNESARSAIIDEIGRFCHDSPFSDIAESMQKYFRTLKTQPNEALLTTQARLMLTQWDMSNAVNNQEYEKAAKFRDIGKALNVRIAALRSSSQN